MWLDNLRDSDYWPRLRTILIAAVLPAVYLTSLWLNFTEADRRSVTLEIPPAGADYLQMDVSVVHVDLLRSEMTTRISFQLAGQNSSGTRSHRRPTCIFS